MDWAVLLMAYGGPDSLEDVEPYLLDVRGGRETPKELVEEVRERYALIGGRSPLLEITRAQAAALEQRLNETSGNGRAGDRYRVFVGMRHWTPYIREVVQGIEAAGLRKIVALCMAPYYSKMSVGAYKEKLRQALEETGKSGEFDVRLVETWNNHPQFLQSLVEKVKHAEEKFSPDERGSLQYVFSAHSLPVAIMQQGDPYSAQLEETARLLAGLLNLPANRWRLCYQSAGAQNTRWLGPTLEETLEGLAQNGARSVLVAPIGFVADHVEILYDIDMLAQETAGKLGLHLERTESPNTSPAFIQALASIVEQAVKAEKETI